MSNATAAFGADVHVSTDQVSYDKIGELRNVRLEVAGEVVDATSFDTAGWRDRIKTLKDWRWSAGGFYLEGDAGQDAVWTALIGDTTLYLRLRPKGSAGGNLEFEGLSHMTAFNIEGAVDDLFAIDLEGVGAGALARAAQ